MYVRSITAQLLEITFADGGPQEDRGRSILFFFFYFYSSILRWVSCTFFFIVSYTYHSFLLSSFCVHGKAIVSTSVLCYSFARFIRETGSPSLENSNLSSHHKSREWK